MTSSQWFTAPAQEAALEIFVHVDSEKPLENYVAIPVTIDPRLITQVSTNTAIR